MPEGVGLPSVESPLAEQILQLIDDYTDSHPEIADVEMAEHINRANGVRKSTRPLPLACYMSFFRACSRPPNPQTLC